MNFATQEKKLGYYRSLHAAELKQGSCSARQKDGGQVRPEHFVAAA